MINRTALLADLKRLVTTVQDDLRARASSADVPEVGRRLTDEYARAQAARRTAATFEAWREGEITQMSVAWILSCVFARFLEDNFLVDAARIAGSTQERLEDARDARLAFFRAHPTETDREYLLDLFDVLGDLPGTADIFGAVNPIRLLPAWLSPEAATSLVTFFQSIDPGTGQLQRDFTDPTWDTRFLGDLYQDLSEAARKRYALLQTPDFIEKFLLDRTLEPALDEFAAEFKAGTFKMIDPACGSGHLVIGSFKRIFDRLLRTEPAASRRELVIRSLTCVHGIDINPFAAAIARFRLLLAATQAAQINRLVDAPAFALHIACGDSLLHATMIKDDATRQSGLSMHGLDEVAASQRVGKQASAKATSAPDEACDHVYAGENLAVLKRLLAWRQYQAIVANPPYIQVKDKVLAAQYRKRFPTAHGKFSLASPFMEQIFSLAVSGGFTGQLTTDSWMKREFGKPLIETFFPTTDLTHVIHCGGVPIPGNNTPSVIVLGRRRPPLALTVRTVMGMKGEPGLPADPAKGMVWTAITGLVDRPGSQSEYISICDTSRKLLHKHPWSIGGGGAAELKAQLDEVGENTVADVAYAVGITSCTGEVEVYGQQRAWLARHAIEHQMNLVAGDSLREWGLVAPRSAPWMYERDYSIHPLTSIPCTLKAIWPFRSTLSRRKRFGTPILERGMTWYEWQEIYPDKLTAPLSIAFGELATHNHFVLDRGGKVFAHTAPVIKLPVDAEEADHIGLLGLLNSSVVGFWLKQVCFPKGGDNVGKQGARVRRSSWDERFSFNSGNVESIPLPSVRPLKITQRIQALSDAQTANIPREVIGGWVAGAAIAPPSTVRPTLRSALEGACATWRSHRRLMIALQEELDWQCYKLYELTADELTYPLGQVPEINLGERAFEIVLARDIAAGKTSTTWFERHGATPITDIPAHWPADYKALVQKRVDRISGAALDANIRLIEQPEYKRRWNTTPYAEQTAIALRSWLLDRIESYFDFDGRMNDAGTPTTRFPGVKGAEIVSVARVADEASRDPLFQEAGEAYRDDLAFDVLALVTELVASESVPALPVERYKPSGLLKHKQWVRTWDLQRAEDTIDARINLPDGDPHKLSAEAAASQKRANLGEIAVPPRFSRSDFLPGPYWTLRDELDVPKERFVSFPNVTTADGTPLVAWAGSDHLQLTKAVSGLYVDIRDRQGTQDDPRLFPLLAVLIDRLPWLKQYHGDIDPEFGISMADSFASFVATEGQRLGKSVADLAAWTPPPKAKRVKKNKARSSDNHDAATQQEAEL